MCYHRVVDLETVAALAIWAKGQKPPSLNLAGAPPPNLTEHLQVCQRASQTRMYFASKMQYNMPFLDLKLENFLGRD